MSNNYQFLSLQRVPIFGGFEPAPSELSDVEEWIESQRNLLANFADEIVDAFAECHRAAAAESHPSESTITKLAKTVLPKSQTGSVWFTNELSTALTLCTSTKLSC